MKDSRPLEACRDDFPPLARRRNGRAPVYFDNACTTLVPRPVIAAMNGYYTDFPACGGRRSHHWFAREATRAVEGDPGSGTPGSRQLLAGFIHAPAAGRIVFTQNATHAINLVALGFPFRPGDAVLVGDREHNSNLMPWLRLQRRGLIRVECVKAAPDGGFDLAAFEARLRGGRVRLVSLALTSNVTGETLPGRAIVRIAHDHGARVLFDGAQTVPHQAVDVQDLDADFLAFSLHKMCGPRGIGVLYAKAELLGTGPGEVQEGGDRVEPAILGGGTAIDTTYASYGLLEAPERFEAGVQNTPGQIGAGAAVQYLEALGMERIAAHEERLNAFLTRELMARYGETGWFKILGPGDPALRGGILTFEVRRPNAVGIARELDARANVMIRDGVFCVHAYFNDLFGPGWTRPKSHRDHRMIYRVSFYLYNTVEECQTFVETLDEVFRERSYI